MELTTKNRSIMFSCPKYDLVRHPLLTTSQLNGSTGSKYDIVQYLDFFSSK